MRITKQQQELLDVMSDTVDSSTYWWGIYWLMDATGRSQQSLSRSMKTFEANGLVTKKKYIGKGFDRNEWRWEYILVDKLEDEKQLEIEHELHNEAQNKAAREAGYVDHSDFLWKTAFTAG